MSDLIDRQAAISYAISGRIRTLPTSEDGENWIRTSEVRQSLLTMPSAQPEPHGVCMDCLMKNVCRFKTGLGDYGYCSQWKGAEYD